MTDVANPTIANFHVLPGQDYTLGENAFHKSHSTGPTITLVRREGKTKDTARVLRPVQSEWSCPFSIEKTTEQCWEMIGEILGSEDTAKTQANEEFVPGYHLRAIEPGELGQASKIQEELDELVEAMEQGVSIMAQCELADLYGAVEAFLENKFPHLGMEDLARMSQATRRAFESGRRT